MVDLPLLVIREAVRESFSVFHYYSNRPFDEPRTNSLLLRVLILRINIPLHQEQTLKAPLSLLGLGAAGT
jgi:hypothetical protein